MRRALAIGAMVVAAVVAGGSFLYARNATPVVPPLTASEAAAAGPPWVVKLHAQWCPVCMLTKGMWSKIQRAYAGRVRLVVFDFTDDATTARSRAEAERLGLTWLLDEAGYATGSILVLDGRDKRILAWLNGSRELAEYETAIDSALAATSL